MITANELRIGNWIMFDNRYFQIECNSVHFPYLRTAEFGAGVVDYNNIQPIPLTEDILLKCGFYHNEKIEYRLHCPEFPITIDIDDFGIQISDSWEFGSIKYLHELQNLYYALTKTELIINL